MKRKEFKCQECGKTLNLKAAEKAVRDGCPRCRGVDIDINVEEENS